MQIVIDISDEEYEDVKKAGGCYYDFGKAIYYGIPLPENHGRLVDADDLRKCFGHSINDMYAITEIDKAPTIIKATNNNNDYTWAKELIKRTGLSIAPEDGSKPYGYDCEDKVWRSDVIDLFGHGSTYTSKEAQKMIKNLPSAESEDKG